MTPRALHRKDWIELGLLLLVLTATTVAVLWLGRLAGIDIDPFWVWLATGIALILIRRRKRAGERS